MRSHTLIIAWFDHILSERNSFSQCILDLGNVSKKGCDVEKILHEEVDIHPTENIYNLNISITRLYVQVPL